MKKSGNTIAIALLGLFAAAACSTSTQSDVNAKVSPAEKALSASIVDESVNPNGAYASVAKELTTGQTYAQTGASQEQADQLALELCGRRGGTNQPPTCAVVKRFLVRTDVLIGGDSDIFKSYACFAREAVNPASFSNRTWVGIGNTSQDARKSALDKCQIKGGLECQITSCTNADYNKQGLGQ